MNIKFLATSDIHGYISPYKYSDKSYATQGLARLAQFIRAHKDENSILIDNGDCLQGSPLTYYHHLYQEDKINPVAQCFNDLNYDYFNIGNHDFNYHHQILNKFIENIAAKCITGNIIDKAGIFNYNYDVKKIEDKRIALVGITNDYIPNWEIPAHIEGLQFENAYEYAKRTVEYIKNNENTDYIVVVYHGGFEKNFDGSPLPKPANDNFGYKIISEIEGIDLLISGHQHRSICEKVKDTFVVQVAHNAQELAYIELDTISNSFSGKLIKAEYEADQQLMKIIEEEEQQTQIWLDHPVGTLAQGNLIIEDEIEARIHKHPCVSFLNQIQQEYYQSDFSAVALFNDALGFNQEITMRDIVSTYVYPNTLIKVKITGSQLKQYLEVAVKYFAVKDNQVVISQDFIQPKPLHYEYDMVDGLDYVVDVSKPHGSRIVKMTKDNQAILDDQYYTMVVNNYRLAGGGNYNILKSCEVIKDDGKEMVEIIAEYIIKNSPLKIQHRNNITIIK